MPLVKSVRAGHFAVSLAHSFRDALRVLDSSRTTELVLIRSDLAAEDGYAPIETMRNRYGEETVRVIGFASKTARDEVSRFLKAGGDDFVHLPISREDLESRLTHTLGIHKQIQTLQRMASRDYLTDLLNRRYFFDRGPKLVDMCLRQDAPTCAALIDIDHFKRLNDTYGHEIGDLVLKAVSRKLRTLVGEEKHLLARLGGEEFAILFNDLDVENAFAFCDYVRAEIAKVRLAIDDEEISVTVSMGLARIGGAETFDNYLNAADQYLYMAKHSGRNRVFSDYQVQRILAS
jgi:diguanylate cyclase (GGDEF)-like protein